MVATSQPLATQAGLAALLRGGNAVDAALATAITLTVVEPASTGIGGDAFALIWDGSRLHGLNGSGRSPASLTLEEVRRRGHQVMPQHGWIPVTVPGAPAAWRDLHQRFGKLPFGALFEDAIEYAERGFPVSPVTHRNWHRAVANVADRTRGDEFSHFLPLVAPLGRVPRVGEIWRSEEMARSLQLIAETDAGTFYCGDLAQKILAFTRHTGGFLNAFDLERHTSTWVEPLSTGYRGYEVWELPPNGQGVAALIALNILEGYDLSALSRTSAESFHLQIEAMKLAFADAFRYVADPEHETIPLAELLSPEYTSVRRALLTQEAGHHEPGAPVGNDTVYLCTADAAGMMVSFIQSTYTSFGSHVVVPETGIVLHNRGSGFSLDPTHGNRLAPGKRPFHTIIPGFLTRDGEAIGPFGVMGGHMQPQGHVQMVVNTVDYGMDPQAALDAPRWFWGQNHIVKVEPGAESIAEDLRRRGHQVHIDPDVTWAGRGQIIWRLPNGPYVAGSDCRADGQAAGY